ncbi:hypothetical protein lerEdw1_009722 [Lerista edwardsae]|nr:hypothetical protein lerEdw1_009722 [Lerista edwardsae]
MGEGRAAAAISEEEAAQYDRQIRLWGLEAQKRCVRAGGRAGGPPLLSSAATRRGPAADLPAAPVLGPDPALPPALGQLCPGASGAPGGREASARSADARALPAALHCGCASAGRGPGRALGRPSEFRSIAWKTERFGPPKHPLCAVRPSPWKGAADPARSLRARLRASRVLLVGMKGLGAEVAKNLILAGVKALTMLDHRPVSPEDAQAQFLIPVGSLGKNRAEASVARAQDLNPMVDVKADPEDVAQKPEEFFAHFDVVCLTCCSQEVLVKVDQICHKHGVRFFAGDVFGCHGYMFANLGEHEFVEEKVKVAKASQGVEDGPHAKKAKLDLAEATTLVKKRMAFCPLKEALSVSWHEEKTKAALKHPAPDYFLLQVLLKFRMEKGRDPSPKNSAEDAEALLQLRTDVLGSLGVGADLLPDEFASCCFSEMAPVCAVVGGVLGQEVVKALSQRDPPLNNFFFFDGMRGSGVVECLAPG